MLGSGRWFAAGRRLGCPGQLESAKSSAMLTADFDRLNRAIQKAVVVENVQVDCRRRGGAAITRFKTLFVHMDGRGISMLRTKLIAAAVFAEALFVSTAFACEGQTGKVIFEDTFADDQGGWTHYAKEIVDYKDSSLSAVLPFNDAGQQLIVLNQTFSATRGDFCVEAVFPDGAAEKGASISVVFFANNNNNFWSVNLNTTQALNSVSLVKREGDQTAEVFGVDANDVIKKGHGDVNSVRLVVKNNGTLTAIVNGKAIKSVRAQIPDDNRKFGFRVGYVKSAAPVAFLIRSFKVTAGSE